MAGILIEDFGGGETLAKRVGLQGAVCRQIGGWSNRFGYLTPEGLPTRESLTALGGSVPAQRPLAFRGVAGTRILCRDEDNYPRVLGTDGAWSSVLSYTGHAKEASMGTAPVPTRITCYDHGFKDNDPVQFESTDVGVTAGVTYYAERDTEDLFYISATPGGARIEVYGGALNMVAVVITPAFDMEADSVPFRLNTLTVWPTKAGVMCYEPDSASRKVRPLGLYSPQDYVERVKPTVTASSAPTPTQLFALNDTPATDEVISENNFCAMIVGSVAYTQTAEFTDYQMLRMNVFDEGDTCPAGTLAFAMSLGAGVEVSTFKYLMLDLVLKHGATGRVVPSSDPNTYIQGVGDLVNIDQSPNASGFEFVLFSDTACTVEIKRFTIPRMNSKGLNTRLMFILDAANMSSTLVRGIGIATASFFTMPDYAHATAWYEIWIQAAAFSADFKYQGNALFGDAVFKWSPWYDRFPPKVTGAGTSAVVLEMFPETMVEFYPERPLLRYAYVFRGRDRLSTWYYQNLLSNPSEPTATVFADPWRYYSVYVTLPQRSTGRDVMDEFGEYFTDLLIEYQLYVGATDLQEANVGVWTDWRYAGRLPAANYDGAMSDSYAHTGRLEVVCTMNATANTVTCTDHLLSVGDAFTFEETLGGVDIQTRYFVLAVVDDDTFTFSEVPPGRAADNPLTAAAAFDISADGANAWSIALPELSIDDHAIPEPMEYTHPAILSARYGLASDRHVYLFGLNWNVAAAAWLRPCSGAASNVLDYGSFFDAGSDPQDVTLGALFDDFAPNASRAVGLVLWGNGKVGFFDAGDWELLGAGPHEWRPVKGTSVPCRSGLTLATCPGRGVIYAGTEHFYLSNLSTAAPISDGLVDFSLVNWDYPHGAVGSKDRYVLHCSYEDPNQQTNYALLIYDFKTQGWRHRNSLSYQFVGMCVDEGDGEVYGLTPDGDIVNVFGGDEDYRGDQDRVLDVAGVVIAKPSAQRRVGHLLAEIYTAETSLELELTLHQQGKATKTLPLDAETVVNTRTQYRWNVPFVGDAAGLRLIYRGENAPEIYVVGFDADDASTG